MMILYWVNRQRHYSQSPLSTNKSTFFSLLYGSMMCLWMNERLVGGSAVAAILKKRKKLVSWWWWGCWAGLDCCRQLTPLTKKCMHASSLTFTRDISLFTVQIIANQTIYLWIKKEPSGFFLSTCYICSGFDRLCICWSEFFPKRKSNFHCYYFLPQCEMEIHLKELYLDYADGLGKHFQKVDISTCLRYHQWINLLLGHICFLIFVECDVNEKKMFFLAFDYIRCKICTHKAVKYHFLSILSSR